MLCVGSSGCYFWGDVGMLLLCVGNFIGGKDVLLFGCCWYNVFVGYGDGYWGLVFVVIFEFNVWGVYDIVGNFSEWVVDCWYVSYWCVLFDGVVWFNLGCC